MSIKIEFTELTYESSGEDDFESTTTYKPSPEAGRRIRCLMGMPDGARTRLSITGHETSQGDGWSVDAQSDELVISAKGYPDYELSDDGTLGRLRRRVEHYASNPADDARKLLGRPAHERYVVATLDDDHTGLVRVEDVAEDGSIILSPEMTFIGPVLNTAGPGVIVVALNRAAALEAHPNLAFTYRNFAHRYDTQLREINHRAWLERQSAPVMGTIFYAEDDEHGAMIGGFRPVDATTVTTDRIRFVEEYTDVATNAVIRWSTRRSQPLNLADPEAVDTAVQDILNDMQRAIADNHAYNKFTGRPTDHAPEFAPVTDPNAVRAMLTTVYASFNPPPEDTHV